MSRKGIAISTLVIVIVIVIVVVVVVIVIVIVVVVVIVIVIAVVVAKHQKRFLASNTKYKMNETGNFLTIPRINLIMIHFIKLHACTLRKSIVKLNQCHYIEKMLLHYENVVILRKKLLYNMKMLLH